MLWFLIVVVLVVQHASWCSLLIVHVTGQHPNMTQLLLVILYFGVILCTFRFSVLAIFKGILGRITKVSTYNHRVHRKTESSKDCLCCVSLDKSGTSGIKCRTRELIKTKFHIQYKYGIWKLHSSRGSVRVFLLNVITIDLRLRQELCGYSSLHYMEFKYALFTVK
jgi:hypothetical protein